MPPPRLPRNSKKQNCKGVFRAYQLAEAGSGQRVLEWLESEGFLVLSVLSFNLFPFSKTPSDQEPQRSREMREYDHRCQVRGTEESGQGTSGL